MPGQTSQNSNLQVILGLSHTGIAEGWPEQLEKEWRAVCEYLHEHLIQIGEPDIMATMKVRPIFFGPHIAGTFSELQDGSVSVLLTDEWRGRGFGPRIIDSLIATGKTVTVHSNCHVENFYRSYGYAVESTDGPFTRLIPPSQRADLREAASICLFHPESSKVLIGERLCPPFLGYYAFPGGGLEPGENPLEAARREFREETGIDLSGLEPQLSSVRYVGNLELDSAYRIHNYIVFANETPAGEQTAELRPEWRDLDSLDQLKCAVGTRGVIDQLRRFDALRRAAENGS